ncbi:hypothetical protein GCM10025772_24790 [Ferrimonas gelatinilytica]|uniref:O-antigen ligase-related domain-containing protein n=2 Tax=Ferrimonas gelatinilytica TaxID=1255257 RepID=A0ABP9SAU2_9GAMM
MLALGWIALAFRLPWHWLFRDNPLLKVLLALGLWGFVLSLFQSAAVLDAAMVWLRWFLQPAMIFLFSILCCRIVGPRWVAGVFIGVILVSAAVAVLQGLEFGFAWGLTQTLENIQGLQRQAVMLAQRAAGEGFDDSFRARGISYSPIHLGYQAALVVAMIYLAKMHKPVLLPVANIIVWAVGVLLLCALVFSGTRSSLFGVILLLPLHMLCFSRYRVASITVVTLGILLAPALFFWASSVLDLRVLSISDSSFAARFPLALLGLKLFVDNPFGYGWLISANSLADGYWHDLYRIKNADAVVYLGIHNHLVSFLFTYGVPGALLGLWCLRECYRRYGLVLLVALAPYGFHALFHNDGIFLGGNYIWVLLGWVHYHYLTRPKAEARSQSTSQLSQFTALESEEKAPFAN